MPIEIIVILVLLIILLLIIICNIKIVPQAQAYVMERLGAYHSTCTHFSRLVFPLYLSGFYSCNN